jgi:uncharacterized membrane protein
VFYGGLFLPRFPAEFIARLVLMKQGVPASHTAVVTKIMPMNNATNITEAEREVIAEWFEAGAKIK